MQNNYIEHEETLAPVNLTPEQTAQQEIRKFNLADSAIAALNEKYGSLTIHGLDDKAGYKAVREAWGEVRSRRTGLEKKGLELRNGYTVITKAIGREEKRLVELISPLEDKLYEAWKRVDEEKERVEEEKREAEERVFMTRLQVLQDFGMVLRDGFYSIGEAITVDAGVIRSMPEDQFIKLRDRAQGVYEAEERRKLFEEQERQRQMIQEKKDREEFLRQQKELQAEREKMESDRLEMERQRKVIEDKIAFEKASREQAAQEQRDAFIAAAMQQAGLYYNYSRKGFEWNNLFFGWEYFIGKTDEEITQLSAEIALRVSEAKKKIEEAKEAEEAAAEKERKAGLSDADLFKDLLGMTKVLCDTYKKFKLKTRAYQTRRDDVVKKLTVILEQNKDYQ